MMDLLQDLTCPVCLDLFNNPVILPCSHVLCQRPCAETIFEASCVRCPVCRENCGIKGGVRNLPRVITIENIIEKVRAWQTTKEDGQTKTATCLAPNLTNDRGLSTICENIGTCLPIKSLNYSPTSSVNGYSVKEAGLKSIIQNKTTNQTMHSCQGCTNKTIHSSSLESKIAPNCDVYGISDCSSSQMKFVTLASCSMSATAHRQDYSSRDYRVDRARGAHVDEGLERQVLEQLRKLSETKRQLLDKVTSYRKYPHVLENHRMAWVQTAPMMMSRLSAVVLKCNLCRATLDYRIRSTQHTNPSAEQRDTTIPSRAEQRDITIPSRAEQRDTTHLSRAEQRDITHPSRAEQRDITHASRAEQRDITHPSRAEQRDITHPSRAEQRDITHPSRAEQRDITHPSRAEQRDITHASRAEQRDTTHPSRAEQRDITHPSRAEQRDITHPSRAEQRDITHASRAEQRDITHPSRAEQRDITHASRAEQRDTTHPSRAEQRDITHPSRAEQRDITHPSRAEQRDTTSPSIPSQPIIDVRRSSRNNNLVALVICPPPSCDDINSYEITYFPEEERHQNVRKYQNAKWPINSCPVFNKVTCVLIEGLSASTNYYFNACAVNSAGRSPSSDHVKCRTLGQVDCVVHIPVIVKNLCRASAKSATVLCPSPGCVTRPQGVTYFLLHRPDRGGFVWHGEELRDVEEHRVERLEPGTDYQFVVLACHLRGECQISEKITLTTCSERLTDCLQ